MVQKKKKDDITLTRTTEGKLNLTPEVSPLPASLISQNNLQNQNNIQDLKKSNIVFNKNGSVQISRGGISTELTKEQYKDYLRVQRGEARSFQPEVIAASRTPEEIAKAQQVALRDSLVQPETLPEDVSPAQPDLLDVGKIVGGAGAGALVGTKAGAALAPVTGGLSVPIGAAVGGLVGGSVAFFSSTGASRKQQTKVAFQKFTFGTSEMDRILADLDARNLSPNKARILWDNQISRINQAEREIKAQQEALFGERLSKSLDELAKITEWKSHLPQYQLEFEIAAANPDPTRVRSLISNPIDETPDEGGFLGIF